ncbi:helix-turn-helix domain-containing protein [Rhabdochromatium marinum]|uniref:helix-turn-helix domain-containing protein n=1 Tax=Rhabdochromatium marinum TaxID=48729 RepID=UPI0019082D7C|nr:helix-turn-helix transcriptional regulator [Rhabdochromatium marinum]MBK1649551.1 hypothetical protein [Rhabdochromatium marinum]
MKITARLAKNTRMLRAAAGLDQKQLADKAKISKSYISKIECGRGNVTIEILEKVAKALGVGPDKLITKIKLNKAAT